MPYTKASMRATDKWVRNNYDKILIYVPKGRKNDIKAYAVEHNETVSSMLNRLIRTEMGISNIDWKYH